ncbi:Uncharacterised protein [Citrobacter koseri]|nr:Uncharacterised protein [Citrobacter koseri]
MKRLPDGRIGWGPCQSTINLIFQCNGGKWNTLFVPPEMRMSKQVYRQQLLLPFIAQQSISVTQYHHPPVLL